MEDLLNKDIFKDKDLCKLSPDYAPSEVLLRMEMRRSIVKHTHNHSVVATPSWQRKSFKKCNEQVMNKEIENIRNNYNINNLKNQVILKRDINFNKLHKTGDKGFLLNDFEEIAELYLPRIPNHDELVICNSDEFKINVKPKHEENVSKDEKDIRKDANLSNQDLNTI
nr:uncharacterized protein LOC128676522 [Plodia interpunctella]